jgi:exopolyphosphatase / guanosine-5'-triphosphate,3'-diphosphate pyrophosphatase
VAVVDIGTNSTRLLIADAADRSVRELERRSIVTRLGDGVDASGVLSDAAQERVLEVLAEYAAAIEAHGCERRTAVLTSAVRDAANGPEFAAAVRDRFGLDGRTLSGDEEARLTFLGATVAREAAGPLLVIDVGGGSTELVVGRGDEVEFHVSTQAGVVRHTERHLHGDPPGAGELEAMAADVRSLIRSAVPEHVRAESAVAVAGTATSCAAIELGVEPFDAERVEGYVVTSERLLDIRARLSALTLAERREVAGLHPDRAPTIVAGTIILTEVLDAFDLGAFEASERDLLWGAALQSAPDS